MLNLIVGFAFLGLAKGGISIPREECTWVGAHHGDWGKCDGDMVAVGACGSGGDQDCPGGFSTGLKCCRFEGFYYGHCEMAISDDWGDNFECSSRVDGQASIVEAICGSGHDKDCEGHSHKAECCEGHVEGKLVGSSGQCTWVYTSDWGTEVECGRSDEMVSGICGSGGKHDCPGGTTNGIYCCELILL